MSGKAVSGITLSVAGRSGWLGRLVGVVVGVVVVICGAGSFASARSVLSPRSIAPLRHARVSRWLPEPRVHYVPMAGQPGRLRAQAVLPTAVSGSDIPSMRTAFSDTYPLSSGGGYTTRVFQSPINYLTGSNVWAPIDDALVADPSAGAGAVTDVADADRVVFPGRLNAAPVAVSVAGSRVGFSAVGAASVPVSVVKTAASYANAFAGVTLRYEAVAGGVKEAIVLQDRDAPSVFRFRLSLSTGLSPVRAAGGGFVFRRADGRLAALRIAAATVQDASGPGRGLVKDVSMRLSRSGRGWVLVVRVNRRWLQAPGRRFPVKIDPTVASEQSGDCWLANWAPTTNLCSTGYLDVGEEAGVGAARTVLGFVMPSTVPTDAVVEQAEIGTTFSAGNAISNVYMYGFFRSGTGAMTWNTYNGTNPWTTPGGDIFGPFDDESVPAAAGRVNWYSTPLVQEWVSNPSSNHGIELVDDNAGSFRAMYNNTSTPQSDGDWPYLEFSWTPRTGSPQGSPNLSVPTSDGSAMTVNAGDGNLELSTPSMSISGARLPFELGTDYDSLGNLLNPTAGGNCQMLWIGH